MLVTSGGVTGSLSHYAYTVSDRLQDEFDFSFLCDGDFYPDRETYRAAFEADEGHALRVPTLGTMLQVFRIGMRERKRHDLVHILTQRYFSLAKDPHRDLLAIADIFPLGLREIDEGAWKAEHRGLPNHLRNASLHFTVRRAARRRLRAIVYSQYTLDQLVHQFSYPPELLDRIPYLLDRRFQAVPRATARERLKLPGDARVVLSVGADLPRKNMAALYHLINTIPKSTTFLRIGPFDMNQVVPVRRPWVRVMDTVQTPVLGNYYSAADVLFFPSFAEGYGVPLLEAMVCGLAIVGSNTTSIPEVAGDAARYAEPHDHAQLVKQVETLLDDPGLRLQLTDQGRRRAEVLDQERLNEAIRKAYREILGK
jgi:glycosyltransferase involved in cell wall biosynthesis